MSQQLAAQILNALDGTTPFPASTDVTLALSTVDPGVDGSSINEPGGGLGYSRQVVSLAALVAGGTQSTRSNDALVDFGTASGDWPQVTHVAAFDSNGTFIGRGTLTTPRTVTTGGSAQFAVGAFNLRVTYALA